MVQINSPPLLLVWSNRNVQKVLKTLSNPATSPCSFLPCSHHQKLSAIRVCYCGQIHAIISTIKLTNAPLLSGVACPFSPPKVNSAVQPECTTRTGWFILLDVFKVIWGKWDVYGQKDRPDVTPRHWRLLSSGALWWDSRKPLDLLFRSESSIENTRSHQQFFSRDQTFFGHLFVLSFKACLCLTCGHKHKHTWCYGGSPTSLQRNPGPNTHNTLDTFFELSGCCLVRLPKQSPAGPT